MGSKSLLTTAVLLTAVLPSTANATTAPCTCVRTFYYNNVRLATTAGRYQLDRQDTWLKANQYQAPEWGKVDFTTHQVKSWGVKIKDNPFKWYKEKVWNNDNDIWAKGVKRCLIAAAATYSSMILEGYNDKTAANFAARACIAAALTAVYGGAQVN